MTAKLDLNQLRVERAPQAPQRRQRRSWVTRWALPLAVLLGFAGLVLWSVRESLVASKAVTVTPVVVTRAEVRQAGAALFQAAGWVEPSPSPTSVTAMVEGVVERLLVVAGQEVKAGDAVATLVDADARLAAAEAEAALRLREAELGGGKGAVQSARAQLDHPVQLQAALADAEAALAKIQTEVTNLPFAIRAAESRLIYARQDAEGKRSMPETVSMRSIQHAESEVAVAKAALEELQSRGPGLQAEAAAWTRKCEALRSQLDLKTEENRRLFEAQSNLASAEARVRQAQLAVEAAKLRLDRMTVRAPITGRVLALNAQPGKRLMGLAPASELDAATVMTLYDPTRLQVRVDVRLEDVRQVQPGQPVQIESAALSEPLTGEVLTATSQADIQKNTLQVKVAIHSPPAVIKPDMLTQVTFLAPPQVQEKSEGSEERLRLLVPRPLVESRDGGSHVWLADRLQGTARRQAVTVGKAGTEQLIEIVTGLSLTDKLIVQGREGLADGERIRITGEDTTLGGAERVRVGTKPVTASPVPGQNTKY